MHSGEFSLAKIAEQCRHRFDELKKKEEYISNRIDMREAQIKRLINRRSNLDVPSWIDEIVEPLAVEIAKRFPDTEYQISGPFGIGCTVFICIHGESKKVEDIIFSLSVRPGDLHSSSNPVPLSAVDYSVDDGSFPPDSIGRINGLHHPEVPIEHMSVDEIIEWNCAMHKRCEKQKGKK